MSPSQSIDAPEFGGYTVVAQVLSGLHREWRPQGYRRQQVHMWWVRRERNGFPDKHQVVVNGSDKRLFRISEVLSWFEGYTPSTGGHHTASGSLKESSTS